MLECIHISDTHEEDIYKIVNDFCYNNKKSYDILCISGDLTYKGYLHAFTKVRKQMDLILNNGLVTDIVWTPGNHDLSMEKGNIAYDLVMELFPQLDHIHLLMHEPKKVQGVKFFGSPWTPWFFDWAFNYNNKKMGVEGRDSIDGKYLWKDIPDDTQVLITHGPPDGILDIVKIGGHSVGCDDLLARIKDLKDLKYHLFGHIHETYGSIKLGNVTYMNSSIMDLHYRNRNKPQEFNI